MSLHNSKYDNDYRVPDPFAPRRRPGASFISAILATALFRCWHILLFFAGWSTAVSVISNNVYSLSIQPTLLTVFGTVLGFVISYRTTSSFERYNEGRRLWSQIILASRTFARTIWFHVPDAGPAEANMSPNEQKSRAAIEKKTAINLLEAYAVAIKHYLRGEDGIYYKDLYYLVKFLPSYALPAGIPSAQDLTEDTLSPLASDGSRAGHRHASDAPRTSFSLSTSVISQRGRSMSASAPHLPLPASAVPPQKPSLRDPSRSPVTVRFPRDNKDEKGINGGLSVNDDALFPARMPPQYHLFDIFPFSLLVRMLTKRGKEVKGKKAAKLRAKLRNKGISHNLPLEISLYLSSYIAALQVRKTCDVPTINTLLASLNQLVDGLTGLERILTTPIPFSYSIHLWTVTVIYCLALPFQIWAPLKWLTIPATTLASFIFFGFLVAGEEIENPFGYDKNDLNLDHFTHNIIRNELRAITSTAPPDPAQWAFAADNDLVFASHVEDEERAAPADWMRRGYPQIQAALAMQLP